MYPQLHCCHDAISPAGENSLASRVFSVVSSKFFHPHFEDESRQAAVQ